MRRRLAAMVLMFGGSAASAQVWQLGGDAGYAVRDGGGAVAWHAPQVFHPTRSRTVARAALPTAPPASGAMLSDAAVRYGLPPPLLAALVWQESHGRADAISPKGAVGLAQLMPATALALGVDAHDAEANLNGGAHYLRLLIDHYGGDLSRALAAYNAGYPRVDRAGGVPAIRETRNYVNAILARVTTNTLAGGGGQ